MKLIGGLVLAALLFALPAHADTIYDVTGSMSFFGNAVCNGQCIETINFSFQLDDEQTTDFGLVMTLLPGMQSTVSGPLPLTFDTPTPIPLPDADGGYISWDDAGDSFALVTGCLGHGGQPCVPLAGGGGTAVFECETAACAADFCTPNLRIGCPGFAGGGGIGVPSTISATVTIPGNPSVPEPGTWALLALGLSMFIPLKLRRLLDGARRLAVYD